MVTEQRRDAECESALTQSLRCCVVAHEKLATNDMCKIYKSLTVPTNAHFYYYVSQT